jgi:hypothetical protein
MPGGFRRVRAQAGDSVVVGVWAESGLGAASVEGVGVGDWTQLVSPAVPSVVVLRTEELWLSLVRETTVGQIGEVLWRGFAVGHGVADQVERAELEAGFGMHGQEPCGVGGLLADETVAAAMIDRLVHHAEVHSLKGDSYRMRGRELGRVPTATNDND